MQLDLYYCFQMILLKNRVLTFSNITKEIGNNFKDYNYILHSHIRETTLALG